MRQGPKKTCVRASRGEGRVTRPDINKTLCPSGLRGWTQVPLAQAAWVQIPQVSISRTLVSAGGGLGGWNGRRGSDELVLVSSYIPLLAYSLSLFLPSSRATIDDEQDGTSFIHRVHVVSLMEWLMTYVGWR